MKVIRGEIVPPKPPLVELYLDYEIEREIARQFLGRDHPAPSDDREGNAAHLKSRIDIYHRMGYDFFRINGGMSFPSSLRSAEDTAELSKGDRGWWEEGVGPIASWEDFERYPWPDVDKADLWAYEFAANHLPEGMGLFVGAASGYFETPFGTLLGCENFCYLLHDNPELVEAVFQRIAETTFALYKRLIGLPNLRGFFQGDDMGYKTGLLVDPAFLRRHVIPRHKKAAELAHEHGLVYLLHCCGHIDEIMPDLIDAGIDGRHSFEDEGNSILDFRRNYEDRTAALGGIDVDKLCRLPEDQLRSHTRKIIEECIPLGRFALGSGNTVCNYIPLSNYLAMVEEGLNFH